MSMCRILTLSAACLAALTLASAATRDALAAYPGANGKIAFVKDSDIYVMEANGTGVTRLTFTPGNNDDRPAFSPDGSKIAFTSDQGGNGWDIWVMQADGSNPTRLTTVAATDYNPTWSPDGSKIAFETWRNPYTEIWVMDADGSNQRMVINRAPASNVQDPAWSPDGSRIAYVRSNPAPAIAAASAADGSGEVILAAAYAHDPTWSPDASRLAYKRTNTATGVTDIHAVEVASGVDTNLTADAANDQFPAWSPDGTQIAYAVLSGQWEIFRMNANGTGKVNVTNNNPLSSERNPDWGPAPAASAPPALVVADGGATFEDGGDGTYTVLLNNLTAMPLGIGTNVVLTPSSGLAFSGFRDSTGTWSCSQWDGGQISCELLRAIEPGQSTPEVTLDFDVRAPFETAACTDVAAPCVFLSAWLPTFDVRTVEQTAVGGGGPAPTPSVSIDDVSVTEGNSGSTNAFFTVSLSQTTASVVTVDFATADGTATAGADYSAMNGVVTFAAGEISKQVAVPVLGDTVDELDETFSVVLSNPSGATLADAVGVATIVNDDDDPPAIAAPAALTVGTNAGCAYVGPIGSATASDDVSAPGAISIVNDAPGAFPLGATTVTWTATDAAGNSASATQLVTVVDDDAPEVAAPAALTLGTNSGASYVGPIGTATVSDNCSSGPALTITNDAPASFPLGETTVTWTATDAAGNSSSATQLVTVVDDDPPAIAAPAALTVGTNAGCAYVGPIGSATASDDVSAPGAISIVNDAPGAFPLGATTVTWTATDAAGNSASATQLVTVVDDDAPEVAAPAALTLGTNSGASYVGPIGTATVSDNCSSGPALTITNDAPASFPLGETTVTWTATDAAGNSSSATQLVTVVDDDEPGELVEEAVASGGTLTTDLEEDGATPSDPIETSVTTPNAGPVSILERPTTTPPATSFSVLGYEVSISAPASSVANPLVIVFTFDASIVPAGVTASTLAVFRNGASVPNCVAGSGGFPLYDPCVSNREALAGGDIRLTVRTSAASVWTFADSYPWSGFFSPVDNLPTVNSVNAGRAIPVKFSLGGDQGLDVFEVDYPRSQQIACDSSAPLDGVEETLTAGGSSLAYDAASDRYTYVWKTEKAWAGTCRQLVLRFDDGSFQRANFKFK